MITMEDKVVVPLFKEVFNKELYRHDTTQNKIFGVRNLKF